MKNSNLLLEARDFIRRNYPLRPIENVVADFASKKLSDSACVPGPQPVVEILDTDEAYNSMREVRGQINFLLNEWERQLKLVWHLEDCIRVADIMMQNMVQADMPKEISRESFRGFARCRLSQYRKIMGDVLEMDEKGGETTNSETIPGGQAG